MDGTSRGALCTRVVVGAPAWTKFVSLPLMALLWVGLLFGLYGLVTQGAGDGVPFFAAAVGWILVVGLVLLIPVAAYVILRSALVLGSDRVERRPGGVVVEVSDLSELRALPASTINRANRGARVQIIGPRGRMVGQLEESSPQWRDGLAVIRGWAAADPSLVKDDYSRSRLLGDK